MKIEKIKPIPKYIKNKIHKLDLERYPKQDGYGKQRTEGEHRYRRSQWAEPSGKKG